jgi:hypothetical protein
MKTIKDLKYVLLLSAIILVLMLVRVSHNNFWQGNIGEAAGVVSLRNNFLTMAEVQKMEGRITLLRLGNNVIDSVLNNYPTEDFTLEDLGNRKFLKKIKSRGTNWVIISSSPSESVKAWIIMNQAGVKKLYISGGSEMNDEKLKYPFQPDTTFRLEPVFKEE